MKPLINGRPLRCGRALGCLDRVSHEGRRRVFDARADDPLAFVPDRRIASAQYTLGSRPRRAVHRPSLPATSWWFGSFEAKLLN